MKKNIKKNVLLGISLVFSIFAAHAGDLKLGYIDMVKIFTTSKPALALENTLKAKLAPQEDSLKKMNSKVASEETQLQNMLKKIPDLNKISAADKANLEKLNATYQRDKMAFQQDYMLFQQKMQKMQDYAASLLLSKTNVILKDMSDKDNLDLVLTSNQFAYAKPKYDVTDKVVDKLKAVDSQELVKNLTDAMQKYDSISDATLTKAGLK